MKIVFVVNKIETEKTNYTTTFLALAAFRAGHQVWYASLSNFTYNEDEKIHAWARGAPSGSYENEEAFITKVQSEEAVPEHIIIDDMDVMMLRNDPAEDALDRPWAHTVGIHFGRLAMRHGVIVLNDPNGLVKAANKMYLQVFPEAVRAKTIITRNKDEIWAFAVRQKGPIILKPVQGSGGRNVFRVGPGDHVNLNQMIEAVQRDGYVIAQEYLTEAVKGDTRLFMMNGRILSHDGVVAAIKRVAGKGDLRSNLSAGGRPELVELNDDIIRLAEMVRPRLVQDGMFLVGLDIVGDKLVEINVFTPGCLEDAAQLTGAPFPEVVIAALERKVDYVRYYHRRFSNVEIATL